MKGEVLDMVDRKGPISLDGLMDQIYSLSQDDVFTYLSELEDDGDIVREEGNLEEHGTTRYVYYVPEGDE